MLDMNVIRNVQTRDCSPTNSDWMTVTGAIAQTDSLRSTVIKITTENVANLQFVVPVAQIFQVT
jgi:hypothetical protein